MWKTEVSQSLVPSVQLCFWGAEDHAANTFGLPCNWKACVRSSHHKVGPRRGSLRLGAPTKVGVGVQMRRNVARLITYPADQAEVESRVDIAHPAMQLPVTCGVQFSDEAG